MRRLALRWTTPALIAAVLLSSLKSTVAADDDADKADGTVAVFTISGEVTEKPGDEELAIFTGQSADSFLSLTTRMRKTISDDDVKAVVILAGNTAPGLAQAEELHKLLVDIKKAGKPVYVHADQLMTRQVMIFSGASEISMSPTGYIFLHGLYGEQVHLRGLLDRLRIKPDFITMGAYKSAAETFMLETASPAAAEMTKWLFDGMYDSTVNALASGRGVTSVKVKTWVDNGIYSAEEAAEAGIIDSVTYRQDLVAKIKEKHGKDVSFDKRYGKKSQQQIDFSNPFAALQLWAQILSGPAKKKSDKDSVAVIYVEGSILPGTPAASPFGSAGGAYSTPIRKALDEAAEDDTIKAVVLRVDSPGGSVVASEIILDATRRVKAKKPIVISMGNTAASGGYYVSCAADTIFAESGTVTGSIGVLSGKFVTTDMWKSVGINFTPLARGKKAGMLGSATAFTEAERARMTAWMEKVYGQFKGHVTGIRGDRLKKPIDELAAGRVWTGQQALEHGLVDKIGGIHDAITYIAEEAKVKDYEVRVLPRPKNFAELLMGDLNGGSNKKSKTLSLEASVSEDALWKSVLPLMQGLDPSRVAAVQQAIQQLDIVSREQISLSTPILIAE
ncbi:MAG: signal peptide peptidase SppA [Planctomycetota bacterium]|nr:signal peptide peptidase SppA [Planctomycetota bacterium]MDA1160169.1 signal peptide peptidase SppA [Planctomycetota bacterium]